MGNQPKQDLAAVVAVSVMFAGAFILPVSSLGLLPIAAGAIVIGLLMLKTLRSKQ